MRPCQTGSNWVQLVQTRWQTWQYGQPDNRGRNGDWPECGRASTGPWWWRRTCQRRRRCRAPGLCWAPSRPAASAPPTGTFRCPCALHPSRCKQKKNSVDHIVHGHGRPLRRRHSFLSKPSDGRDGPILCRRLRRRKETKTTKKRQQRAVMAPLMRRHVAVSSISSFIIGENVAWTDSMPFPPNPMHDRRLEQQERKKERKKEREAGKENPVGRGVTRPQREILRDAGQSAVASPQGLVTSNGGR